MGLESAVMIFPQDPAHRLVQADLAAFLDRLAERLVALGSGATAYLRAGRYESEARSLTDLLASVDRARQLAKGREDLRIRIEGLAHARLARFLGTPRVTLEFRAFVHPHLLLEAKLCSGCGWPLDHDASSTMRSCGRGSCGDGDVAAAPMPRYVPIGTFMSISSFAIAICRTPCVSISRAELGMFSAESG